MSKLFRGEGPPSRRRLPHCKKNCSLYDKECVPLQALHAITSGLAWVVTQEQRRVCRYGPKKTHHRIEIQIGPGGERGRRIRRRRRVGWVGCGVWAWNHFATCGRGIKVLRFPILNRGVSSSRRIHGVISRPKRKCLKSPRCASSRTFQTSLFYHRSTG